MSRFHWFKLKTSNRNKNILQTSSRINTPLLASGKVQEKIVGKQNNSTNHTKHGLPMNERITTTQR
jgi:hypothetical protein